MAKAQSRGTCVYCGGEYPKPAMSRHLAACARRGRKTEERLPIVVEGRWAPEYWLHLELKPRATLGDLDDFLRRTWLECCGHMSSFEMADRRFDSDGDGAESMDVAVADVLRSGATARYVYDFGSSTELTVRALAPRPGAATKDLVHLVARNAPPAIRCKHGHGEALHICPECGEALCAACAPGHDCGDDILLPVVNSPRVGTCAYGA